MVCHIGDVLVHNGNPPEGNPYKGKTLMGDARREALRKFKYGEDTEGLTFWYAPCFGGASQCTRDEVNWQTSGIL